MFAWCHHPETQKRGAKATASLLQSHLPSVTTSVWPWPQAAHRTLDSSGSNSGVGTRLVLSSPCPKAPPRLWPQDQHSPVEVTARECEYPQ